MEIDDDHVYPHRIAVRSGSCADLWLRHRERSSHCQAWPCVSIARRGSAVADGQMQRPHRVQQGPCLKPQGPLKTYGDGVAVGTLWAAGCVLPPIRRDADRTKARATWHSISTGSRMTVLVRAIAMLAPIPARAAPCHPCRYAIPITGRTIASRAACCTYPA